MAKRRKQQNIEVTPVVVLLVFTLGFGIYNSQTSLILIATVLLLIILLVGLCIYLVERARRDRLRRSGIAQIDLMSGPEFEKYLQVLLSFNGFKNINKPTVDLGVDIVAVKDGVRWAIQAKRYKGAVGLDAVRQVTAAMSHYKCDKAMVITNSYFTQNAKTIASSTRCALIDRDELITLILRTNSAQQTT